MSKRHRQISQRVRTDREQAYIRYVYGKRVNQRVRMGREYAIIRYV